MKASRRIAVIGTGYVGLVYAVCMAELGHEVTAVDVDATKIETLAAGRSTIYEPGLDDLLQRNLDAGRLRFTTDYAIAEAEFIFLAVSTPSTPDGAADLSHVRTAVQRIAQAIGTARPIIINKSTAPVGTGETLDYLFSSYGATGDAAGTGELPIVANPEFLREGSAIQDFFHPDRVVLGSRDEGAALRVAELYKPLNARVVFTDLKTAEMIKYASNAFLATKISFINEIASICEGVGADIADVARAMGMDERIGERFLQPGLGFGGSCLPKDVRALAYLATVYGAHPQMLNAVLQINAAQRRRVIRMVREALGSLEGRVVALLGLAFKPGTDDIREAPSVEIAALLRNEGAEIRAYDPFAAATFGAAFPDATLCDSPMAAAAGADAALIITEWDQIRRMDLLALKRVMRTPLLGDCRNTRDGEEAVAAGFAYFGAGSGLMGREHIGAAAAREPLGVA